MFLNGHLSLLLQRNMILYALCVERVSNIYICKQRYNSFFKILHANIRNATIAAAQYYYIKVYACNSDVQYLYL